MLSSHALRLIALPEPQCTMQFAASWCNYTVCGLTDIEIRFTHQVYNTLGALVGGSVGSAQGARIADSSTGQSLLPYTMMDAFPLFKAIWSRLIPGGVGIAQYRLCVQSCITGYSVKTTATVHPPPSSNSDCVLPSVTVPADVQAIWAAAGDVPAHPAVGISVQTTLLNAAQRSYFCC